ncbi:MAG: HlyD family efflux transporter periplasmic adaptor subunit, partial [Saprospiraceae bacterium]|nr:HlyD family efflux transporter periplasmic adaptor subunit [Saprospiraceae bacterium]
EGSSVIERNNFNEGTSIAVVADMNSLIFEGKVDESEVGKLKEGMLLELTVGAIEEDTFTAILEHISPQGILEEGTVKFEIKAAVEPAENVFLRAGYSASGDIILDRREQVLSVYERDILFEQDSTFVEIQTGDQQSERKRVRTGLSDGIKIEILDGLSDSDKVKVQKKI